MDSAGAGFLLAVYLDGVTAVVADLMTALAVVGDLIAVIAVVIRHSLIPPYPRLFRFFS